MTCRTCSASYPEAGDGQGGECGNCADRTQIIADWWDKIDMGTKENVLKGTDACPTSDELAMWWDGLPDETQHEIAAALRDVELPPTPEDDCYE